MFKRLLIAMTFVGALTFAGVGTPDTAEAQRRWGWGRPYVSYYSGPPAAYYDDFYHGSYYGGYVPYRSYYAGPRFYRPYYPYYRSYYGGPGYFYGPRSGVYVSFGY